MLPNLAKHACDSTQQGCHGASVFAGMRGASPAALVQVMVWKTNFDRHLDEFVLSHIEKGETQLQHETQIFANDSGKDIPPKKSDSKVKAAKSADTIRTVSPNELAAQTAACNTAEVRCHSQ
jgi:hypothetical protein